MLPASDRPIWNGDATRIQKASVRLALNLPHTSSSHLDALTCTLHNAWATWIYIIPPPPGQLTHAHTCTVMQKHTSERTMTGAYMRSDSHACLHAGPKCAHTHMCSPTQINAHKTEGNDSMVTNRYVAENFTEKSEKCWSKKKKSQTNKKELFCNLALFGSLKWSILDLLVEFCWQKKDTNALKALIAMKHTAAATS